MQSVWALGTVSTHISYACTIAEGFTREGLLDAMRRRHNYAATDSTVLDHRTGANGKDCLPGDIVAAEPSEFELRVRVSGTAPAKQIDVIQG